MASATGVKKLRVQDSVFDLDRFEEVTLVKDVDFTPITDVNQALDMLSNDGDKLLRVINKGLESEARIAAKEDPNGFQVIEDGEIKGPFTGVPANMTAVNSLVLTLAKTVFGFSKDMPIEGKQAAKESAKNMIRSTPAIREGLKKSAALKSEE